MGKKMLTKNGEENILTKIALSTKERVQKARSGDLSFPFEKALRKGELAYICEVKKASPSKGIISMDFDPVKIALDYEAAGADAISVLTEPEFFQGSIEYLKDIKEAVKLPILRKDFILEIFQIYESKFIGADAILLIASLLSKCELKHFLNIANDLGLSCLVETHTKEEIEKALGAGARIIGVNNRNLKNFKVDLERSVKLRNSVPEDIIFISESGISSRNDIIKLEKCKVDAVLIGETMMVETNRKAALKYFKGK